MKDGFGKKLEKGDVVSIGTFSNDYREILKVNETLNIVYVPSSHFPIEEKISVGYDSSRVYKVEPEDLI